MEKESLDTNNFIDLNKKIDSELNFGSILDVLIRRKKLALLVSGSIFTFSIFFTTYQRIFSPEFSGSFSILISDPLKDNNQSGGSGKLDGSVFEELAFNETSVDIPTLIEFLRSPFLLQPIADEYNLNYTSLKKRIGIAQGGIDRRDKRAKGVINVSLKLRNKKIGLKLLKKLSNTYIDIAQEQRQKRLTDGLSFLDKQAPNLQSKTEKLQEKLSKFRTENNLIEPSREGISIKKRSEKIEADLFYLQGEKDRLNSVKDAINNGTLSALGFQEAIFTGSYVNQTGGASSSGLKIIDTNQNLIKQIQKVEAQLAEANSKYLPTSSYIKNLESKLKRLRPLLRENQINAVDAALSLNQVRLETTQKQKNSLNKLFQNQPELIKEFDQIKESLNLAQQNLIGLVNAREKFQLQIAQQSVPWTIISPPFINPRVIRPSISRNILLGIFLSLVLGYVAAILRDKIDNVFHSTDEVKESTKETILGEIPFLESFQFIKEEKKDIIDFFKYNFGKNIDKSIFSFQESLRNLYTSIKFLNSDYSAKVIGISSSIPAEGKTLINILLAKTLTDLDKKVLLVDADLRKPQIHTRLALNNIKGLSNLLTGQTNNYQDLIQKVNDINNLSVITSGTIPPDSTRLLSSEKMKNFISELRDSKDFDIILIDAPPIIGLADTIILAEQIDGIALVVSLEKVDKTVPRKSLLRLKETKCNFMGIVVNCTKKQKISRLSSNYYGNYNYVYDSYNNLKNEKEESTENQRKSKLIEQIISIKERFLLWIDR